MSLADKKCIPCRGGVPPLPAERTESLLQELGRGWSLNTQGHLERLYTFKDFAQSHQTIGSDISAASLTTSA